MYDLHSHIIWEVDDGSQSLDMSKQMIYTATQTGTKHIFATSHIIEHKTRPSWDLMQERSTYLETWAREKNLDISIYPGGEVYMNWDLLDHLTSTKDYRLAHSRYMLVELPMREIPIYADEFLYELKVAGITPILAHPERYRAFIATPEKILKWRREGLLLQINAGSITGFYGKTVKENANWLLKNSLVDFIGSDAHSTEGRTTNISEARHILKTLVDEETYNRITIDNPKRVVDNQDIDLILPDTLDNLIPKKKKSFWQRLF